ncbi:hypothetical protein Tco_0162842 [Tanacetum coccineum]
MSHSLQTLHMLGTQPKSFYDPNMKTGHPKCIKKAIQAQPKMYNDKNLKYAQLTINLPDSVKTLENAKKSRLKMKDKMIQLDYAKLNKLYESFVPQKEISADQTYLSPPSTSNVTLESSPHKSSLPPKKMLKESQLLKLFVSLEKEIQNLDKLVHINLRIDTDTRFIYNITSDIRRIFGGMPDFKIIAIMHKGHGFFCHLDFIRLIRGERGDVHCSSYLVRDTPDTPPSQDPYEVTVTRWRSRSIHIGRPYRTQLNEVLQMLTARNRVGPLPTHRLVLRYTADYSSSNHFTSDDSSRDYPSDSSSETLSDSYSNTSFDSSARHSSSGHPISDSLCDSPTAIFAGLSRKRCRDSNLVTDFKVSLEDDYVSYVPREADIDECFVFADVIRARGMDVRVVVETAAKEEVESSARGMTEVEVVPRVTPVIDDDVCESVREDVPNHVIVYGAVKVTYETLEGLVQRFHDHTKKIPTPQIQGIDMLERDNVRLRGMLDVERQRPRRAFILISNFHIKRLTFKEISSYPRSQRDDYFCGCKTMPTATRSGMTQATINELIANRVEEALKAYDTPRNPETETEMENEQQDDNVNANCDNGNDNGNGNGNPNANNGGVVPVA